MKNRVNSPQDRGADVARDANVAPKLKWRAGPAPTRRGTRATWQGRAWPTRGVDCADTWQKARGGPRERPRGVPRGRGVGR